MPNREFVVNDEEWARELETSVEKYTDMLLEALWETSDDEITETLSGEPFCGCSTCFWRETIFFITPKLLKGYEQGKISLEK